MRRFREDSPAGKVVRERARVPVGGRTDLDWGVS